MYFSAKANNHQRTITENLDSFNELQEFMNKMERRGFLKVNVSAYDSTGLVKTIEYNYNGLFWEK